MGDTKEATKGHLEISDFSTEAVEVMLKYMYTNENVQDEDINFDLLALADKYDLKFLLDECVPKFIKKIDLENCLEVYNFAFMHNLHRVKIGAFQFIKSNWNKVKHEKERRNNLHPKASEELIDLAMYAQSPEQVHIPGPGSWVRDPDSDLLPIPSSSDDDDGNGRIGNGRRLGGAPPVHYLWMKSI